MTRTYRVLIVATMDTKAQEVGFLKECLEAQGVEVLLLDAGIKGRSPVPVDISREQVAAAAGSTMDRVRQMDHEGKALEVMIAGAIKSARQLYRAGKVDAVAGLGGSMGTTLGTAVMRALPLGFPKLMISTMASRNTRPFVGTKDIMMLHSVCDLSGLNRITRQVIGNGALALAGMVRAGRPTQADHRPLAVLSTLGTTEACVSELKDRLEKKGKEAVIFHTVGSGGEAMEELINDQPVWAVLDISLHELVDHLFGGDYDAGPRRGLTALEKGIPTLLVPGNTDFLVTGPLATAKRRFPGRRLHAHNSAITTVSVTPREMEQLAEAVVALCAQAKGPVALIIPMGGFSALDCPGGPMENPEARRAFAKSITSRLPQNVLCLKSTYHINDPGFAAEIMDLVHRMCGGQKGTRSATNDPGI